MPPLLPPPGRTEVLPLPWQCQLEELGHPPWPALRTPCEGREQPCPPCWGPLASPRGIFSPVHAVGYLHQLFSWGLETASFLHHLDIPSIFLSVTGSFSIIISIISLPI